MQINIRKWVKLIAMVSFAVALGCGSAIKEKDGEMFLQGKAKGIETTVKVKNPPGAEKFETIMIIGLVPREDSRKSVEDAMVKELSAADVGGVAAYQALLPGTEITKEAVGEQLKDTGVDGVLVVRLKDVSKEVIQSVPREVPSGVGEARINDSGGRDLYGYWADGIDAMRSPGFAIENERVDVLTRLYGLKDGKMVWQGKFTTTNPNGRTEIIRDIARMVLTELKDAGIIESR